MNPARIRPLGAIGALLWIVPPVLAAGTDPPAPIPTAGDPETADEDEKEPEKLTIQEALASGRTWVQLRYRFEEVDQDSFDDKAHASTLRTVLGYESAPWRGFSALVEAEDVSEVGPANYNSTVNGETDRPVVADPDGTEVNQSYLQYTGLEDFRVRAGRQRITLANHRFVGNVGWRQNEQTYDAWSVETTAVEGFTIYGAYVTNVNRVLGEDSLVGDFDSSSALVHVAREFEGAGTANAYYYDLDFESAPGLSSSTFGASWDGRLDGEHLDFLYRVEIADQSDAGDNPNDVSAGYTNLEIGADVKGVVVKLGMETLEGSGDPGDSFQTPLATGHKFNGWADKFLATPDDGLEDVYVSVGGVWQGTNLEAVYHDFSSDSGGLDYGTELDLVASRKFDCGITGGLKYAGYSADDFSDDTTKAWFWMSYSF